jgi:ring-1,2-phenylacetyl-CoA epoxidase subunit PaaC
MQASISLPRDPKLQYLLRIGDTCLVLGQRLGEWCGHGPVIEEDIALTNMALDLIGQARAVLTLAGEQCPQDHDEDQLAFLRDERDYLNPTIAELPRGDFAFTVLRNTMLATWLKLLWERLRESGDAELAAIAGKALKEARYHQQHAADWVVRLGDGTDESRRRSQAALTTLWPYTAELFESDAVDAAAEAAGLGPAAAALHEPWLAEMTATLGEAGLEPPQPTTFRSRGRRGVHSEHMGYILAEMQYLQRAFPGGAW